MILYQTAEHVVRRNLESMDYRYCLFSGPVLVIDDVLVLCNFFQRIFLHDTLSGRNPCLKFNLPILKQGSQRYRLEYRSWFSRTASGHVECLDIISEAVFLEVDHRSDRTALHVHDDHASFLDVLVCSHMLSQSLVCNVLHVDVKGRNDIRSVLS